MAEMDNVVLGSKGFLFILETMGPPNKPIGTPFFGGDQEKTVGHGPRAMAHNVNPNLDQRMSHRHFYNNNFLVNFFFEM